MSTFDEHGIARLGESPGDSESKPQVLELQRRIVTKIMTGERYPIFDLTIYRGDEDMSFYGIGQRDLAHLGQALIRLSQASLPPTELAAL